MKHQKSKKIVVTFINESLTDDLEELDLEISGGSKLLSKIPFFCLKTKSSDELSDTELDKEDECPIAILLEFEGDVTAKETEDFARAVDLIISRGDIDEVYIKIKSGGGTVNGYGLFASQIERLKVDGIKTFALVDEVAASGGYMAACVADKVIAAPFAYIGSVGVVSSIPNIHNFLKSKGVDVHQQTAGEHKRTVTVTGKVSEEDLAQHKLELESIHEQFQKHVLDNRKEVDEKDFSKIFSGAHWTAQDTVSQNLNLVDELGTSSAFLLEKTKTHDIFKIEYKEQKKKKGILSRTLTSFDANSAIDTLAERIESAVYKITVNSKGIF